jgi:predicted AAA+ superfamily ATPase
MPLTLPPATIIPRRIEKELLEVLAESRIAFLTGPRQAGKSTLVRAITQGPWPAAYTTLDDLPARAAASADPQGFLRSFRGPVAIDEAQRVPELLLAIKQIVDMDPRPGQFLLTGSADVLLLPKVADPLVGRVELLNLRPLSQAEIEGGSGAFVEVLLDGDVHLLSPPEVTREDVVERVVAGGYPEALRRGPGRRRDRWFRSYVETVVKRELRAVSRVQAADELPRLLQLLVGRNASIPKLAGISRGLQISETTVSRYLSLLEVLYLVRRVPAWLPNIGSRAIRAPRLYICDSGLACHVMNVDERRLALDPNLLGGLLEAFVGMEIVKALTWSTTDAQLFHWRTAGGVEVDQVLETRDGRVAGLEIKAGITVAAGDFRHLAYLRDSLRDRFVCGVVLYLGSRILPFGDRLWAVPISALWT